MRLLAPIVALACVASARPQPIELTPGEAFADALQAYGSAPYGEDILIAITRDGQTRRDRVRTRVAPGTSRGVRAVRFDLGTLHVHAEGGRAIAVDDRNAGAYARLTIPEPLTPDAMANGFRPVPLPSWELLSRGEPDLARPVGFVGPVLWTSAVLDPGARPAVVTVRGASARARLELVMLAETGRFRRLTVETLADADAPETKVELTFTPFDPGPVESWALDLAGRDEFGSVEGLARGPRLLAPGEPIPELGIADLGMRSWSWRRFAAGRPCALVFFRLEGDPDAAIASAKRTAEAARAGSTSLPIVIIGVVDLARFDGSTIGRLETLRGVAGPFEIAWTSSSGDSIARFSSTDGPAVAFVNAGGTLRRVVEIMGEESFSDVGVEAETASKD